MTPRGPVRGAAPDSKETDHSRGGRRAVGEGEPPPLPRGARSIGPTELVDSRLNPALLVAAGSASALNTASAICSRGASSAAHISTAKVPDAAVALSEDHTVAETGRLPTNPPMPARTSWIP